jgi:hypothetical protein
MRDVGTLAVEGVLAEWEDRTRLSGDLAKMVEEETRGGAEVNDRDGCTEYRVRSSDDGLPGLPWMVDSVVGIRKHGLESRGRRSMR